MVIGILAASWGFVMAVSPVLQIVRMLRLGSSRDVSVGYFVLLIPGFLLWVMYGLARSDLFLALPNALATIVGIVLVAVALILRRTTRISAGKLRHIRGRVENILKPRHPDGRR